MSAIDSTKGCSWVESAGESEVGLSWGASAAAAAPAGAAATAAGVVVCVPRQLLTNLSDTSRMVLRAYMHTQEQTTQLGALGQEGTGGRGGGESSMLDMHTPSQP